MMFYDDCCTYLCAVRTTVARLEHLDGLVLYNVHYATVAGIDFMGHIQDYS